MLRKLAILAALFGCAHSQQPAPYEYAMIEYLTPIEGEPAVLVAEQKPVAPAKATVAEPTPAEALPLVVKPFERAPVVEVPTARIYFVFDKSSLTRSSRAVLDKIATTASAPGARVRIEGNCDERGSNEYNIALGQRRAESAKAYLVRHGVPADNITTLSFGEERPKVIGHDESSWRENRRDDLFVQGPAAVSQR
jgi:peptidoglycan-associated lipoprotein